MVDILLIEDDWELSQLMSSFLRTENYSIYCAMSGEDAVRFMEADQARLVLLDIMLPGMDGFAVCSRIRQTKNVPILIMSARVDKESKISGFSLGADDYIEKPVDIDILLAKVAALFKRFYEIEGSTAILTSGEVEVNQDTLEVFFHGKKINLTMKEYDLLLLLIENKGKTLSKEYLFSQIWGADSFSENQTLTVHIKMLRDKIEENPKQPQRIRTVWGTGYRYEEI